MCFSDVPGTWSSKIKTAAGNSRPPPPYAHSSTVSGYRVQHPEPQHPSRSAFASAVGHSSTQHTQVHWVHRQAPVSQQPQQSHFGQPAVGLPSIAGTKGTRPSAAQSKKLFMEKLPIHVESESISPRHDM